MLTACCWLLAITAQAVPAPVLLFTDLISGPSSGNSDNSQAGQTAGQDGAIVTVWGRNLGTTAGPITVGGVPARIYSWGNADHNAGPADLYTTLHMQMVVFQVPHGAPSGATTIQAIAQGSATNTLPFTVRPGHIYFVKTNGDDVNGDGSWSRPWQRLANASWTGALSHLLPGDILYVGDGVRQTEQDSDRAVMYLETSADPSTWATEAMPKALIAYPGARVTIGNSTSFWSWSNYNPSANSRLVQGWTISKLNLTANQQAAWLFTGFRVVGNYASVPTGSEPTGAVTGLGNNLLLAGNEVTQCGFAGTSKLFHPIYIESAEDSTGPTRLPTETNREIAWNYVHDNFAYDGINIYREGYYSAYMTNQRIHDNYILNQTGRGMLIGDYMTGENWVYNNIIVRAGQGPDPNPATGDSNALHVCVDFQAGAYGDPPPNGPPPSALIHFYNNTLYGCGWASDTVYNAMIAAEDYFPFQLDFRNNIIQSTGAAYANAYFHTLTAPTASNNLWFGNGPAPSWDSTSSVADPKLADPAHGDVHLQTGSPAIDRGSSASPVPAADFDNVPRPQGAGYDIGAYEYNFGSPPPPSPTIALSQTTLSFNGIAGAANPANQTFSVSNSASNSSTLNWSGSTNQSWLSLAPTAGGNGPTTVTVSVNTTGLAAGSYSGTLTFSDPNASNNPQSVAVTLTLSAPLVPALSVSPGSLSFAGTLSGTNPASRPLQITNVGTGTMNWSATTLGSAWLSLSGNSGSLGTNQSRSINVSVNLTGLAANVYRDTITVTAAGAIGSPQQVPVTLTVSPAGSAVISLDQGALSFSATAGGANPPTQTLNISNIGSGGTTLNWTVASNASWLVPYPTSGALTGGQNAPITVYAYTTSLTSGTYTGSLTFSGNAANSPQIVSVNLSVSGGGGKNLVVPNLSGLDGKTFSLTDDISFSYPLSGVSFGWTFESLSYLSSSPAATGGGSIMSRGSMDPRQSHSGMTAGSGVPFATTSVPHLTPASAGLGPGKYLMTVTATQGNQSQSASATITLVVADFSQVKVYPNPWRSDRHATKNVTFANLPLGSTVKLFTASGHKVKALSESGGQATWDLKNDSDDPVASGVYVYLITAGDTGYGGNAQKVRGKLAVIK